MDIFLTIVAAVVILSLLILIHELGHFAMAKRAGIKVEEFGMGLPPRIWGKKKGETLYSLNAIPFGGFVKMYGEDQSDPKMAKDKRSFAGKSVRQRVFVIVAGVVMNFLLAFVLLSIGFGVGMKPLLVPDEVYQVISDGGIVLDSGLKVEAVSDDLGDLGFVEGDVIWGVDSEVLDSFLLAKVLSGEAGVVNLLRDGVPMNIEPKGKDLSGLSFVDGSSFPRLMVKELADGVWSKAGVEKGDVILKVNGIEVFDFDAVRGGGVRELTVYRDGVTKVVSLPIVEVPGVLVSRVVVGGAAEKAGFVAGDVIEFVDGERVYDSQALIERIQGNVENDVPYVVKRGDKSMFFRVKPDENGRIGVMLSNLVVLNESDEVQLAEVDFVSTVSEVKEVKVAWYLAPVEGFKETVRFSGLTFKMIVGVFGDIFSGNGVPDGVSGPIGIAKMTYGFVQEGFVALLQFVALLSLSLAVINILPIPALDGGRLLFIVIEVLIGRKVNQKFEGYVHGIGYLLLIGMILLVTYNDILHL